jgi:hypothetical protein
MSRFLVLGLPRSRTYWCSCFLSRGRGPVGHDIFLDMTKKADVVGYFEPQNAAAVDTCLGFAWPTLVRLLPHVRLAVVSRPVEAVIQSFARLGLTDPILLDWLLRYDKSLGALAASGLAHVVTFADLSTFAGAGGLFAYCRGEPCDPALWEAMNDQNLQCDIPKALGKLSARAAEIDRLFEELAA